MLLLAPWHTTTSYSKTSKSLVGKIVVGGKLVLGFSGSMYIRKKVWILKKPLQKNKHNYTPIKKTIKGEKIKINNQMHINMVYSISMYQTARQKTQLSTSYPCTIFWM